MSDDDHCQNHPERPVTARCTRFNRRFCDLDFAEDGGVECLSAGMYCEDRGQCLIWARVREKKRKRSLS